MDPQRKSIWIGSKRDLDGLINFLRANPVGYWVALSGRRRSVEQNAHLWAICTAFSEQAVIDGKTLTPDRWKAVFMHSAGHKMEMLPSLDGGWFATGFRSSKLSVKQMSELIELMIAEAAQRGVKFHWEQEGAA